MHTGEMLGSGGMTVGGGMAVGKTQEPTSIDRLGKETATTAERTHQMAHRVKALADKLEGSHPEPMAAPTDETANTNGVINAISREVERQIVGLDYLDTAISRLERLI